MFDVGFAEIMLIGIVSLVVIGPERLPAVARTVGLWVGKMRRFVTGVKSDFAKELESGDLQKLIGDQKEQINELRGLVETARGDLKQASSKIVEDTSSSLKDLKDDVDSAKQSISEIGDTTVKSSTASGLGAAAAATSLINDTDEDGDATLTEKPASPAESDQANSELSEENHESNAKTGS